MNGASFRLLFREAALHAGSHRVMMTTVRMATSRNDTILVPPRTIPEWTPEPLELPLDEPLPQRPSGNDRPTDPDAVGSHVIVIDVA